LKKIGLNRLIKAGKALILLENSRQILAENSRSTGWQSIVGKIITYFQENQGEYVYIPKFKY